MFILLARRKMTEALVPKITLTCFWRCQDIAVRLTIEGPSASIDAFKFLHADKSRFLKYYRFVLFDFYYFIGKHFQTKFCDLGDKN